MPSNCNHYHERIYNLDTASHPYKDYRVDQPQHDPRPCYPFYHQVSRDRHFYYEGDNLYDDHLLNYV